MEYSEKDAYCPGPPRSMFGRRPWVFGRGEIHPLAIVHNTRSNMNSIAHSDCTETLTDQQPCQPTSIFTPKRVRG